MITPGYDFLKMLFTSVIVTKWWVYQNGIAGPRERSDEFLVYFVKFMLGECLRATYINHAHDQQHFTISEATVAWYELMVLKYNYVIIC